MTDLRRVDGNALGGILSEIFVADMTTATTTCGDCRAVAAVATLSVYLDAPGVVARCPDCGAAQIRVVSSATRLWFDLSGIQVVEVSIGETAAGPGT